MPWVAALNFSSCQQNCEDSVKISHTYQSLLSQHKDVIRKCVYISSLRIVHVLNHTILVNTSTNVDSLAGR